MSWIRDNTLNWIQYLAIKIIKTGRVPKHIAIIMDGNRRYANKNNVAKVEGHSKGFDKLAETLQWCMDLGITEVTVYAFSIENFKRTKEEVDSIMELACEKFKLLVEEIDKLMEHGVCFRVIGNFSLIPDNIRKLIAKTMIATKDNRRAFLNVAFGYTSRDEIIHAIKDSVNGVENFNVHPSNINDSFFSECLYSYNSPEPELLIRTSGEVRLSDFLMWQTSSTHIYFVNVLWPEFTVWHLLSAVFHYQRSAFNDYINTIPSTYDSNAAAYIKQLHKNRQTMLEKLLL